MNPTIQHTVPQIRNYKDNLSISQRLIGINQAAGMNREKEREIDRQIEREREKDRDGDKKEKFNRN